MRRFRALGAGLLVVALAAGCAEPKYHYVVNGAENVSYKVPRGWQTFSLPTGAVDRLSPDSPGDVQLLWSTGFDADPNASEAHLAAVTNYGQTVVEHAVGIANVYQIQGSFNQRVSLTEARKAPLGVDPLYVPEGVQSLVEIIKYEPVKRFRGLQGSRVQFNMRARSDAPWSTYDMLTFFDQGNFRLYTFTVGCIGRCFEDSKATLADIIDSWRFEQ